MVNGCDWKDRICINLNSCNLFELLNCSVLGYLVNADFYFGSAQTFVFFFFFNSLFGCINLLEFLSFAFIFDA